MSRERPGLASVEPGPSTLQWSPGPMSGERGTRGRARPRARLQWSPGPVSGERSSRAARGDGARASMEPRTDVQGEVRPRALARASVDASMEPRTCVQGEARMRGHGPDALDVASMEPRTCVQGEALSAAGPDADPGFNGAPDRCPGRGARQRARVLARSGFNGAPDLCPGRGAAERRRRRGARRFNGAPDRCPGRGARRADAPRGHTASMEPRTGVRGEASRGARITPCSTALQWSPGAMSGERPALRTRRACAGAHFNGAPDRCPGRAHDCSGCIPAAAPASMEPRSDVQGEAVRLAGKEGVLDLQWSPGAMSGESGRCRSGRNSLCNFNGAPERCPGRGRARLTQPNRRAASMEPRS